MWTRVCIVLVGLVYAVSCDCNVPPSLWCSSGEVAQSCGVYEQCRSALMRDPFAKPVNLTLYYESLCPDCKQFINDQLYNVWKTLGEDVVNLTLVPYGNAREKKGLKGWDFTCQHGEQECVGNLIETCAIALLEKKTAYVPFIYCMEGMDIEPAKAAQKCGEKLGIDIDDIMKCSTSSQGNNLEHEMALLTDALNPPHRYVPWIVINDIHTEKMQNKAQSHLLEVICETYKGDPPTACSKLLKSSGRIYKDL
ncbi:antigen processing and presentation of exogenous peptide antigen via MHC class I [Mactra antiquata]